MYSNVQERYLNERVATASPAELTAMLFDAAVGSCTAALRSQESGAHLDALPRLLKAQRIVNELRLTLNPDAGELARNLDRLYVWCHERLVAANRHRSTAATNEALQTLQGLQEAWRQACCAAAVA